MLPLSILGQFSRLAQTVYVHSGGEGIHVSKNDDFNVDCSPDNGYVQSISVVHMSVFEFFGARFVDHLAGD
jgi:hypothetical protein